MSYTRSINPISFFKSLWGFVFLIVFFGWFVVSVDWYACAIFNKCRADVAIEKKTIESAKTASPIVSQNFDKFHFLKDGSKVFFTGNIKEAYPIVSQMTEGGTKEFHITGLYYKNETIETGLERANSVKKYFSQSPWFSQIRVFAKEVNSEFIPQRYSKYSKGVLLNIDDTTDKYKVIGQNIYFSTNASNPHKSNNIQTFLKAVAQKYESGKIQKIKIIGHTDNQGKVKSNEALGLKRSNTIKNILIEYGVKSAIITALSMGPHSPVESNDTVKGRSLNRRVEIIIE